MAKSALTTSSVTRGGARVGDGTGAGPKASPGKRGRARPAGEGVATEAGLEAPVTPVAVSGAELDRGYRESVYLAAFPAVAVEVAGGRLGSGLEHYLREGRALLASGAVAVPSGLVGVAEGEGEEGGGEDGGGTPSLPALQFGASRAGFDEALYLAFFPNVADIVTEGLAKGGVVASAFDHWVETGFREVMSGARTIDFGGVAAVEEAGRPLLALAALLRRPFGINLFAPLSGDDGAGETARAFMLAIRAAGIPVDLWAFEAGETVLAVRGAAARRPIYRVSLVLAPPASMAGVFAAYPAGTFDDCYAIAFWSSALGSFPAAQVVALQEIDEVWTGSEAECHAIAAMARVPVEVVPVPVSVPEAGRGGGFGVDVPAGAFVFVSVLDLSVPAGLQGVEGVMRAFAQAATGTGDAMLIVAVTGSGAEMAEVPGEPLGGTVRVLGPLGPGAMEALRARADCLISAHRGTGPALEIRRFAALGKPVIATRHGVTAGDALAGSGYGLEFDLEELRSPLPPYPAGHVVAVPRQAALVAAMREVLGDRAGAAAKGAVAAGLGAAGGDAGGVGQRIVRRLSALRLDIETPPFVDLLAYDPPGAARLPISEPWHGNGGVAFSLVAAVPPGMDVVGLEAFFAAVEEQTQDGWELLLLPRPGLASEVRRWIEMRRGSGGRLRVMPATDPGGDDGRSGAIGAVEAATCSFVVFLEASGALAPEALEELMGVLRGEPAVDIVHRGGGGRGEGGFVAVRKRLLLGAGLADLDPADVLAGPGLRRILGASRLLRTLGTG